MCTGSIVSAGSCTAGEQHRLHVSAAVGANITEMSLPCMLRGVVVLLLPFYCTGLGTWGLESVLLIAAPAGMPLITWLHTHVSGL